MLYHTVLVDCIARVLIQELCAFYARVALQRYYMQELFHITIENTSFREYADYVIFYSSFMCN